jgi:hypothetical protein
MFILPFSRSLLVSNKFNTVNSIGWWIWDTQWLRPRRFQLGSPLKNALRSAKYIELVGKAF